MNVFIQKVMEQIITEIQKKVNTEIEDHDDDIEKIRKEQAEILQKVLNNMVYIRDNPEKVSKEEAFEKVENAVSMLELFRTLNTKKTVLNLKKDIDVLEKRFTNSDDSEKK